eukprot:TRINITY_DN3180_c0_g1_i2.p1 TRINITY_DN3180_c0_g1~~TRINITY_DN3180_c0_g1_i2.p1  ORF type:complete len:246 (-),score=34.66 TRINITY_DN3180_c0_g1_i2:146-856(-)
MKKKDKDINSPVFPNEIEQYMKNEEKNKVYVVADKANGRFQLWSNKKYRKFDNMKILDLDIRYLEDFNVEKKGNKYIFSFMDKKTRKTMKFSDKENPIRMMNTLIHYKQCLGSSIEKNENINSEKKTFSEENIKIHFNGKNLPNNQSCPNLTSPLISPRQPTMPSSTSPRQTTSPNIHVNMQMMQMIQYRLIISNKHKIKITQSTIIQCFMFQHILNTIFFIINANLRPFVTDLTL